MGCIPSKALLHSTEVFHELKEHASAHGIICKELDMIYPPDEERMELLTAWERVRALVIKKELNVWRAQPALLELVRSS